MTDTPPNHKKAARRSLKDHAACGIIFILGLTLLIAVTYATEPLSMNDLVAIYVTTYFISKIGISFENVINSEKWIKYLITTIYLAIAIVAAYKFASGPRQTNLFFS